jgi:hypothetical protein
MPVSLFASPERKDNIMKVLQISHNVIHVDETIYLFASRGEAVAFRDCVATRSLGECTAAFSVMDTRPVPPGPKPQE